MMPERASDPQGENALLRWLAATDRPVADLSVPLGDDAAVWRLPEGPELVLAADALAEGSHFEASDGWQRVGWKALAVNLSDIAAMGARPLCAVATAALPHGFDPETAHELVRGLRAAGERYACPLVGGDTITHAGRLVISVTVLGRPLPGGPVTRGGGRPGDALVVTGVLGGSRAGRHLDVRPRLPEARRLMELGPPTAMIDVSDGLLLDLWRLADASGTGFELELASLPLAGELSGSEDPTGHALADGEDFELLCAIPAERLPALRAAWDLPTPLSVIGRLVDPGRRVLRRPDGEQEARPLGYEHR